MAANSPKPISFAIPNGEIVASSLAWEELFGRGHKSLGDAIPSLIGSNYERFRALSQALGPLPIICHSPSVIPSRVNRFSLTSFVDVAAGIDLCAVREFSDDSMVCGPLDTQQSEMPGTLLHGRAAARANQAIEVAMHPPISQLSLTRREVQIVTLLARGLNGPRIAGSLGIAEAPVQTHVRNAMGRVGQNTRAGLVAFALAEGLIKA